MYVLLLPLIIVIQLGAIAEYLWWFSIADSRVNTCGKSMLITCVDNYGPFQWYCNTHGLHFLVMLKVDKVIVWCSYSDFAIDVLWLSPLFLHHRKVMLMIAGVVVHTFQEDHLSA